jgi:hypothetical protein
MTQCVLSQRGAGTAIDRLPIACWGRGGPNGPASTGQQLTLKLAQEAGRQLSRRRGSPGLDRLQLAAPVGGHLLAIHLHDGRQKMQEPEFKCRCIR